MNHKLPTRSPQDLNLSHSARYLIAQSYCASYIDIIEAVAEASNRELVEWQHDLLTLISATDNHGQFIHRRVGISIPRQAGKTTVIEIYVLFLTAFLGAKVLWTSHDYRTARKTLEDFRAILGSRCNDKVRGIEYFNKKLLRVSAATSVESFTFRSLENPEEEGGFLQFATRTKNAALGNTFDIVVIDEAQEVNEDHLQILLPTTSSGALKNPQYIYMGTPRRAGSNAAEFERMRTNALDEDCPDNNDLLWCECGLAEIGDIRDESRWFKANLSLAAGIANPDAIRSLIPQLGEMAFAQECLGVWLDPVDLAGGVGAPVVGTDIWDRCATSTIPDGQPVAFAIKFSVDGLYFSICVAVPNGEKIHIELVDRRETMGGKRALIEFVLARAQSIPFVIDGRAGAKSLIERIEGQVPSYNIVCPKTEDVISANTTFLDSIAEGSLTWFKPKDLEGTDAFTEGVTKSYKRKIGTGGGWGFDGEYADIAEAAALCVWHGLKSGSHKSMEVFF